MAKMTRPCPNCKFPLAIPQPMPERFACPKCGVVMKRRSAPAQPAAPIQSQPIAPPPPATAPKTVPTGFTPSKQLLLLGGFITLLLGGIGVVLIMLIYGIPGEQKTGIGTANGGDPSKPNSSTNPNIKQPVEDKRPQIVKPFIDKGREYLLKRVQDQHAEEKKDGNLAFWGVDWERGGLTTQGPGGVVALVGFTLLETGVSADNEEIHWLAETVEKQAGNLKQTHPVSAAVLLLCRWHESRPLDDRYRRLLQTLTLRLISGQLEYGAWMYDLPVLNPGQESQLLKELKAGTFKPNRPGAGTAAFTNFAIQALWMARKHGIPVRESLLAAGGHFQRTQLPNGSWAFSAEVQDRFLPTATATGLIALAMEKAILYKDPRPFIPAEKTADPAKAFAFIAKSIGDSGDRATYEDVDMKVGKLFGADSWGDLYYLWAIERVAMIYEMETIDGKDWYEWGYKAVLAAQSKEDGSWSDRHGPLADTCFALLFLKRSNFTPDLTAKLKELR